MAIAEADRPGRPVISLDLLDRLNRRLNQAQAICEVVRQVENPAMASVYCDAALWAACDLLDESLALINSADKLPNSLATDLPDR